MRTPRSGKEPPVAESLHLQTAPLDGIHLIEASAGTGKTYTIAALYLRLILEKRLSPDQILVMTFTEAATEELKGRIRDQLKAAVMGFERRRKGFPPEAGDAFIGWLVDACSDPETAFDRLCRALRDFDESAIFTIHGFCRRMLRDNAFETGLMFDSEMLSDSLPLIREMVADYWRRNVYLQRPLFVRHLLSKGITPGSLVSLAVQALNRPEIEILPPNGSDPDDQDPLESGFLALYQTLKKEWATSKPEVARLLLEHPGLNRTKFRAASVQKWIEEMDGYLNSPLPGPERFEAFAKFTPEALADGTKKGHVPLVHPFFDSCSELAAGGHALVQRYDQALIRLKADVFGFMREERRLRRMRRNVQTFDDLLLDLEQALRRPDGGVLSARIRNRFQAAMIDEFQDTDPIQYAIISRIFGLDSGSLDTGASPALFLIGDPKQAIYAFRGADIFTYMEAARRADRRFTLDTNWRSRPDLIHAVNTVFGRHGQPFVYAAIPFQPVRAPAERTPVETQSEKAPVLTLWWLPGDGKPIARKTIRPDIIRAVAAEILSLLKGGRETSADGQGVEPGDIAVLVRTNREAEAVQDFFGRMGIVSVRQSTGDIFDTREALEMDRILTAVVHPGADSHVRGALVTDAMGFDGQSLERTAADPVAWDGWVERFHRYHREWVERGFLSMWNALSQGTAVIPRLMAFPDGPRRATNMRHVAELVHRASVERKAGMMGVIGWLRDMRLSAGRRAEENPIRLESDASAVQLVTIHRSKGLEYPVVFCPFLWHGVRGDGNGPVFFHDPAINQRLTVDLGSENLKDHLKLARRENLAEDIRLLYVALTRARDRCYLVWGRFNKGESAGLAYVLHGRDLDPDQADLVDRLGARVKSLSTEDLSRDIGDLAHRGAGSIRIAPLPAGGSARRLTAETPAASRLSHRVLSAPIVDDYRITSFSALTGDADGASGGHDAAREAPANGPSEGDARDIFTFPRGAGPGTCLHAVFEQADFTALDRPVLVETVHEILISHHIDPVWTDVVCDLVRKVVSVPLEERSPRPVLSEIPPADRINELGFYFPIRRVTPEALNAVFRSAKADPAPDGGLSGIEGLRFSPVEGMMRGFIDMVYVHQGRYYLVDWKSNYLGPAPGDYRANRLGAVMAEKHYILQYHIYILALHRYLRLRLPGYDYETHFGGVQYLFLRGMDPKEGSGCGIYRDRPPWEVVRSMGQVFWGADGI